MPYICNYTENTFNVFYSIIYFTCLRKECKICSKFYIKTLFEYNEIIKFLLVYVHYVVLSLLNCVQITNEKKNVIVCRYKFSEVRFFFENAEQVTIIRPNDIFFYTILIPNNLANHTLQK